MATKIREIRCRIVIVLTTTKNEHELILNLDDYGIEMTVGELLTKAKEWFDSQMGGL